MAHDAFNACASIAFRLFLSLVPLLVLVGYLVGRFARARGVDQVIAPLLDVVPGGAEELIRKELGRLAGGSAPSVAPLGLAGFLWAASSGLHNVMSVLESGVFSVRRPWWKKRLIALLWVILGLAVICAFVWFVVHAAAVAAGHDPFHGVAKVRSVASRHLHHLVITSNEQALDAGLALLVGTAALAGFYRFAVEHPRSVRRRVGWGALAAVLSWLLVSWAFGAYAVSIQDYAIYYGGLAAVAVLLLWLYLTSLALVLGAEVNAQLEGLRDDRPPRAL